MSWTLSDGQWQGAVALALMAGLHSMLRLAAVECFQTGALAMFAPLWQLVKIVCSQVDPFPSREMTLPSLDWYKVGQTTGGKLQAMWESWACCNQPLFVHDRPCVTMKFTMQYRDSKGMWFYRRIPAGSEWVLAKPVKEVVIQVTAVRDSKNPKYNEVHLTTNFGNKGMLVSLDEEKIRDVVGVFRQHYMQEFSEPELLMASVVDGGMKRLNPCVLVKNLHKRERNDEPLPIVLDDEEAKEAAASSGHGMSKKTKGSKKGKPAMRAMKPAAKAGKSSMKVMKAAMKAGKPAMKAMKVAMKPGELAMKAMKVAMKAGKPARKGVEGAMKAMKVTKKPSL